MSRFFPHSLYAEDQPLAKTILATHILTRAFQTGTVLGLASGFPIHLLLHSNFFANKTKRFPILTSISIPSKSLLKTTLKSTGTGAVLSTVFFGMAIPVMMRGKEEIEWKDRTWRLLENRWQMEVDDFSYAGTVGGGVVAAVLGNGSRLGNLGWRGKVGVVGLGGLGGLVGYFGWRYGIHGGEFKEEGETEVV